MLGQSTLCALTYVSLPSTDSTRLQRSSLVVSLSLEVSTVVVGLLLGFDCLVQVLALCPNSWQLKHFNLASAVPLVGFCLGLCDNRNSHITIMLLDITIITIVDP